MAKNAHRVPKKQWNRWSKAQQAMFNRTMFQLKDQKIVTPHMAIPKNTWSCIRWNAAFLVACEAGDMKFADKKDWKI